MSTLDRKYLELLKEIVDTGTLKHTRAGDTLSVFSKHMEFDLKEGFPILTTKKTFYRGFIHECLWFLHGDTNIKYLIDNNVHIWDDDAYRYYTEIIIKHNNFVQSNTNLYPTKEIVSKEEFLKRVAESRIETGLIDNVNIMTVSSYPNELCKKYTYGDLGPIYGKQWRHFGASNKDQIAEIIEKLKTNPDDRRMLFLAFNPDDIDKMALPPCHIGAELYTRELSVNERLTIATDNNLNATEETLDDLNIPTRELSLCWMQRSCDLPLGFAGNVICYSLILSMIAKITNMTVGKVSCWLGDCHIYTNQLEGVHEQLSRNPGKFKLPTLLLDCDAKTIDDFKFEDIKIINYESFDKIYFPLSVG